MQVQLGDYYIFTRNNQWDLNLKMGRISHFTSCLDNFIRILNALWIPKYRLRYVSVSAAIKSANHGV